MISSPIQDDVSEKSLLVKFTYEKPSGSSDCSFVDICIFAPSPGLMMALQAASIASRWAQGNG